MIGTKEYIEEDWEKISDEEKMFLAEKEEDELIEFWTWYKSQEANIILVSQSENVEKLPF